MTNIGGQWAGVECQALDRETVEREIAAIKEVAVAHERTVERRLLGLPVKGSVARRVDDAIERRGLRVQLVRVSGADTKPNQAA